jgi:uncharacterized protein
MLATFGGESASNRMKSSCLCVTLLCVGNSRTTAAFAWTPQWTFRCRDIQMTANSAVANTVFRLQAKAGTFFNPVPERDDSDDSYVSPEEETTLSDVQIDNAFTVSRQQSKAAAPSTINGVPSSQVANGSTKPLSATTVSLRRDPSSSKPYVGVGPATVNGVQYDDQGYTLYANEKTGEKSRVFEALVEYPCLFTLKVVGANDGDFVRDVLAIISSTCQVVDLASIEHTVKHNGKWASITVKAPVQSAQMLYQLYEDIDRDPRVKFKF